MSHGTVPVFRAPSTTFLPSSRDIAPRPDPGKPSRCKARCSSPAATSHQIAQTPRIGAPYPYRREATQQSLTTSHPEAAARDLARWFDSEHSMELPARLLLQAKIDMPHASNPPPPRHAATCRTHPRTGTAGGHASCGGGHTTSDPSSLRRPPQQPDVYVTFSPDSSPPVHLAVGARGPRVGRHPPCQHLGAVHAGTAAGALGLNQSAPSTSLSGACSEGRTRTRADNDFATSTSTPSATRLRRRLQLEVPCGTTPRVVCSGLARGLPGPDMGW